MITLDNIKKEFASGTRTTCVLNGINLSIHEKEFVAIVGQSGSGKTTLMNILGCLDRPSAGSYSLDGQQVLSLSDNEVSHLRNRCIGFVFQTFHLLPRLTVLENVLLPLMYARRYPADAQARAENLIELVGLSARRDYFPGQLSGGQQQRVAVARALINTPRVVLADEPTGNLDAESGAGVLELFRELNRAGKTIILVTHSPDAAATAQRVIGIRDGRIVSDKHIHA
jgi:putative ABC transport system ATP-binding protein